MKIKNKTITTLTLIALFTGGPMAWAEAGWVSGTLDLAKVTFIPKTSFCVADVDGSRDVNYPDTTCNFSNGFALGEFYIEASQSNTDQHFE